MTSTNPEPLSLPEWLSWARRIQAIAQNGLAYSENAFEIERCLQLQEIAEEILTRASALPREKIHGILESETGRRRYATPKLDVRGAAFRGSQVLLVRELLDGGRWTLPGGWMDAGDTPGAAVAREFREETGYEVHPLKLALVYDRDRHGHPSFIFSIIKLFFVCDLVGGSPAASIETGESAWFNVTDLPELSIGRVTPEEINSLFRHYLQPNLPTEFDC